MEQIAKEKNELEVRIAELEQTKLSQTENAELKAEITELNAKSNIDNRQSDEKDMKTKSKIQKINSFSGFSGSPSLKTKVNMRAKIINFIDIKEICTVW